MELEKQIRLAGRVDSVIQKGMQEGKITGACVGIYQNQEEYLCKAYGLADREQETPMRTDTLFRIFSMTKPVTAVATMQLGVRQAGTERSGFVVYSCLSGEAGRCAR